MKTSARFVMIAPIPAVVVLVVVAWPVAWTLAEIVGLALLVGSLALVTVARQQLGDAFSVEPRATTLVTHGLYARIRNPIYVFALVMLAGLLLYLNRPWLLLLLVPVGIAQAVRARREAKVLEQRFGEAYRAYRAGTWF
jgi:protein-S-isoprenylcysteine O-methyltransferase Ste14